MTQTNQKVVSTAEFSAQYKDPRWQKKRLEVLEQDNFTCRRCGASDSYLHIHHACYHKGNKVWEYEPQELITLCSSCHEYIHYLKSMVDEFVWHDLFDNYRYENSVTYEDICSILLHINSVHDVKVNKYLKKLAARIEKYNAEEYQQISEILYGK